MSAAADNAPPSRSRFSLQARLLAGVVVLIVLCMGAAIVATVFFGRQVADDAIDDALSRSQSVQARFVQLRLEQLEGQARWFARDPAIISYFQEAADSNSTVSLLDLLAELQADVDFDVALVLDADGILVARTDDPESEPVDMYSQPLVEAAFEEGSASGFWLDRGVLYTAVAAPLTQQFDLVGFLVLARRVDDAVAAEVERLSSARIAYLVEGQEGLDIVATTLDPAEASRLLVEVRKRGGLSSVLGQDGNVELTLGREPFEGLAAPLRDAYDDLLGASVALASRRERTANVSRLIRVLWAVGLASLALGVGLAALLSRRLVRPIRSLVSAAEAARDGDYDQHFGVGGSDEVGRLSRAFDGLLGQLRAERELQTFVRQLSKTLPEPGEAAAPSVGSAPRLVEAAVVAVDLRGTFAEVPMQDSALLVDRLEADVRRLHHYSQVHGGELIALLGHRLYLIFPGAAGAARALVAISDGMKALVDSTSSFYDPRPPMSAVTMGSALFGPIRIGGRRQLSAVGPVLQELDGLLREASPGDLILSRRVREAVGGELESAAVELRLRESLLSTQQHFLVDVEAVSRDFKPVLGATEARLEGTSADGSTLVLGETPSAEPVRSVSLLEPGAIIGDRYEILSILGMGGMGVVYKARDRELADLVALKALRPNLVDNSTMGADTIQRLKDELRLARKVTHPNVLRTYDFQVVDGQSLISMEYVRGITLRYMMERSGGIPRSASLRLLQQLCAGLQAAHEQEVLHCDIKPENIILEPDGHAKLMDFGIARPLAGKRKDEEQVFGTPFYMAPEQITGGKVDARSDIYACGVVAYELLVGRLPFKGSSAREVFQQHLKAEPPPPRQFAPNLPAHLEAALLRCLAKDPANRFQSAAELDRALSL